jgi:hypothetical protein
LLLLGLVVFTSWTPLAKGSCFLLGFGLLWLLLWPPKDELAADFLPHKCLTTSQYYTETMRSDTEGGVVLSTHEYKDDGLVEVKTYNYGATRNGVIERDQQVAMRPVSHSAYRRRINRGFVEVGSQPTNGRAVQWEPVIKIGARKGDSWEDTSVPGLTKRYTVMGFAYYTIKVTGAVRRCVVIRQESVVDGKLTATSESTYVKGVGEQQRVSYEVSAGTPRLSRRVTLWDEAHAPCAKCTRDFFE